jgi:hypothetical protein
VKDYNGRVNVSRGGLVRENRQVDKKLVSLAGEVSWKMTA